MPDTTEPKRSPDRRWGSRLAWFAGLWVVSLAFFAGLAYGLRALLSL